jgi:hypothetical protein
MVGLYTFDPLLDNACGIGNWDKYGLSQTCHKTIQIT